MTADKKAKELVNSFYQPLGLLHCQVSSNQMWEHAKQCAIIAVDEIIKSSPHLPVDDEMYYENHHDRADDANNFWQSVKQSINNQ